MYCANCGRETSAEGQCEYCNAQGTSEAPALSTPPAPSAPGASAQYTMGIVSMVLGIVALPGMFCCVGYVVPIAAIILAVMSRQKEGPNGYATAGLVLGIIGCAEALGLLGLNLLVSTGHWTPAFPGRWLPHGWGH